MAWEPLVGTVGLLSRGESRSCLGGSGELGKRAQVDNLEDQKADAVRMKAFASEAMI